jgi:hypothetical protein
VQLCTTIRFWLLVAPAILTNIANQLNLLHVPTGCVNDTAVMKEFLKDREFKEDKIRVLTDDQVGTQWMPTRENILESLTWLVSDAQENDSYVDQYICCATRKHGCVQ